MTTPDPKSISSLDGTFGWQAPGSQVDLKDIVQQLQGFRISTFTGGNQSTNFSLKTKGAATGAAAKLTPDDVILGVLLFTATTACGLTAVALRSDAYCPSAGNIRLTAEATTGATGVVFWWDTSGYVANA